MTFGSFIKDLRIERGLTLREASVAAGVLPSSWSKMERDINPAPRNPKTIALIKSVLYITGRKLAIVDALAFDSYLTPPRALSEADILDHFPLFIPHLTPEQEAGLRKGIIEAHTRDADF